MNKAFKLMRNGASILLLAIIFHLGNYIYREHSDYFELFKSILIFLMYLVGFLMLRKGFFKNGASFLKNKNDE